MRILVIGSGGQVGFELMRAAWPAHAAVTGRSHGELDIVDVNAVQRAIAAAAYDVVINAAGYTAVDRAESDLERAYAVNRDGASNVAAACARSGARLIHLSTDYVFDGTKPDPYVEGDPVAPINVYGASKAAGEAAVRAHLPQHAVLRTSWVYGAHGNNFVKTMLRLARQRKEIAVVDDQTGSPTAAADIAHALTLLAGKMTQANRFGTYHLCGGGATTWYGFARRIFSLCRQRADAPPAVRPISSQEFAASARRPVNSRLDCGRIAAAFGIACPPWEASLARDLPEIEAGLS